MPIVKIHLDREEYDAIKRRAEFLGVTIEDLAFGALNCSMTHGRELNCAGRIASAIAEHGGDLPLWSDRARSVHAYEGRPDDEGGPAPV